MMGMNRADGAALDGDEHLVQSIEDILTTPIGSMVMLRDYGSNVPELLDQPFNGATRLRFFAAVAQALLRWEPRVRLKRVAVENTTPAEAAGGRFALVLEVERRDRPVPANTRLTIPLREQFRPLAPILAAA